MSNIKYSAENYLNSVNNMRLVQLKGKISVLFPKGLPSHLRDARSVEELGANLAKYHSELFV